MASTTGIQTRDTHKERTVVIEGTAKFVFGDDVLIINIPVEDQPPTGRTTQIRWEIKIVEKDV